VLEVPLWVSLDLVLGESIAGTGDEDGHVNDEAAEAGYGGLEAWEHGLGRPDVGGKILGKGGWGEVCGGTGALQGRVDVEGAVGIVGALEGVDLAVLEGLLAEGPAGEVLGLGVLKALC
jgi:hypothetical protein